MYSLSVTFSVFFLASLDPFYCYHAFIKHASLNKRKRYIQYRKNIVASMRFLFYKNTLYKNREWAILKEYFKNIAGMRILICSWNLINKS